jgi:hypothetical protein
VETRSPFRGNLCFSQGDGKGARRAGVLPRFSQTAKAAGLTVSSQVQQSVGFFQGSCLSEAFLGLTKRTHSTSLNPSFHLTSLQSCTSTRCKYCQLSGARKGLSICLLLPLQTAFEKVMIWIKNRNAQLLLTSCQVVKAQYDNDSRTS